jgi:2-oxoglutarate ferredoxin oxidoreductase subunit alpha
LVDKIRLNVDKIVRYEEKNTEDAELIILSYGISSRIAEWAMLLAREQGKKVGFFRLITAWPFPEKRVRELAAQVEGIVVVEINMGQMVREVERVAGGRCKVLLAPNPGGRVHMPEEVLSVVEEILP